MQKTCTPSNPEGDPAPALRADPFISIVVPVRNEAQTIEMVLRDLLEQNYDANRFEVIVADGLSTDSTRDIVERLQQGHSNLQLLENPRRLASAGRNLGIQASSGDIVLIIDGHCDLETPDYLTRLADVFTRSGADCVGRPQPLDIQGAAPVQRAIAAARSSWLGHHPDSYVYSATERFVRPQSVAVAYRRSVIEAIGPFDEDFDACEDVEFNTRVERAGFRCFLSPQIRVRYHPRTSLSGLFRQLARYGRGRMRLLRKYPETFSWPCFLPPLCVLGAVLGPALLWFGAWWAGVYLAALGMYLGIVLATSAGITIRSKDLAASPWLPLIYLTIHFGAGVGVLHEWIWGRRRPGDAASDLGRTTANGRVSARA
jgi:succinoglycan biosynthesis protein ExoA